MVSVIILLQLTFFLTIITNGWCSCEVSDYYKDIPELEDGPPVDRNGWVSLSQKLYTLLYETHNIIPYTSSATDVWDALIVLDQDPANSSQVWLIYANRSAVSSHHGDSTGWNREHLIPRSYGLFDNGPDYSDLHNLRASDANVNSARNNLYYDDCYPSEDPTCQQPAHIEAAPDTAKNSLKFMPPEKMKGDLARSTFYMSLRYNGRDAEATNTEQIVLSPCACVASQMFGNLTTLLRWSENDGVDAAESSRNNLTCSLFQKNRNPFVDYPWLSDIFRVSPPVTDVSVDCDLSLYSNDPDDCDTSTAAPTSSLSPSMAPSATGGTSRPSRSSSSGNLQAGDVAVVGFNSDNPDSFALVALRDIPGGTEIFMTDNGWMGEEIGFRSGEGHMKFSVHASAVVPAGTVWCYPYPYPAGGCGNSGDYGQWTDITGSVALSTSGDQIVVYTGSAASPTVLYLLTNTALVTTSEAVSSTTTMLPASLEGSDAYCVVSNVDNSVYMGGTSGTASDLLAWVSNSSLWSGSDSVSMSLDQIGSFSVFADPTISPTSNPTASPSLAPSLAPSAPPSVQPTFDPTVSPSAMPTLFPTASPSSPPSVFPSVSPTDFPTNSPTVFSRTQIWDVDSFNIFKNTGFYIRGFKNKLITNVDAIYSPKSEKLFRMRIESGTLLPERDMLSGTTSLKFRFGTTLVYPSQFIAFLNLTTASNEFYRAQPLYEDSEYHKVLTGPPRVRFDGYMKSWNAMRYGFQLHFDTPFVDSRTGEVFSVSPGDLYHLDFGVYELWSNGGVRAISYVEYSGRMNLPHT